MDIHIIEGKYYDRIPVSKEESEEACSDRCGLRGLSAQGCSTHPCWDKDEDGKHIRDYIYIEIDPLYVDLLKVKEAADDQTDT